jgi:hypothetical protein
MMELPEEITIDFDELTLGDVEQLEEIAGPEAADRALEGKVGGKALVALAYITLRKTNPEVTLDDVRKVKVAALNESAPKGTGA